MQEGHRPPEADSFWGQQETTEGFEHGMGVAEAGEGPQGYMKKIIMNEKALRL